VASSLQSPELFIIAKNLADMQVEAAIDESDVGRVRAGQTARFTVDAFPGQSFEGEVRQVRKAALNVANVVTYVAVIAYSNADGRLMPGMTANVRVVTDQRTGVLQAPNAALRLRIAGVDPAPLASDKALSGGRLFVMDDQGKPKALAVRLGITDGNRTELILEPGSPAESQLTEGKSVLVGTKTATTAQSKPVGRSPF
jgi:HlyD family secretion protein